jgi:hypothetical protein
VAEAYWKDGKTDHFPKIETNLGDKRCELAKKVQTNTGDGNLKEDDPKEEGSPGEEIEAGQNRSESNEEGRARIPVGKKTTARLQATETSRQTCIGQRCQDSRRDQESEREARCAQTTAEVTRYWR